MGMAVTGGMAAVAIVAGAAAAGMAAAAVVAGIERTRLYNYFSSELSSGFLAK
jgi:DNA-binding phage protein